MKIISKTLTLGVLSAVLVACGDVNENNDNNDPVNNTDNNNVNEENNNDDANDDNTNGNDENDDVNNETDNEAAEDDDAAAEAGELPVTVDHDAGDGELVFDMDGEEYSKDAETFETDFGKEVTVLDGMEAEYIEQGNQVTADFSVEDEGHEMDGLTFTVEEAFTYEGDAIVLHDVDLDNSLNLETTLVENTGHVDSFDAYAIEEDETPLNFYFDIDGDASQPGQWSDAVAGEDYKEYKFHEIVEEGQYIVTARFPADVDEEFEATALAMALSFGPEGTTADMDEEETMDEDDVDDEADGE